MIYLLEVYALVTVAVFSALGVVYLALATVFRLLPAVQRARREITASQPMTLMWNTYRKTQR